MTYNATSAITPIFKSVVIMNPSTFLFRGEPVQVAPGPVQPLPGFPSHPLPSLPMVRDLQSMLYSRSYIRNIDDPLPSTTTFTSDPTFVQRLSQGNRSQQRWEAGWNIYAIAPNGVVSVQKGDRQRNIVPGEFLSSLPPGVMPQAGTTVTVLAPRESVNAQPGFYFAYGETLTDSWDDHSLLRFYFHVASETSPELMESLTLNLNRYQVPFRMKALTEPAMYQRSDATVLYVARRYYDITARIVHDLPSAIAGQLREDTPLFTKTLLPGVGMAEDPNTGESFGMHRCRMLAEGIVDAWMNSDQSVEGRMNSVAARFAGSGFRLDLPYLNPGSVDLHEIPTEVDFAYA